jgi:hypothetical protein
VGRKGKRIDSAGAAALVLLSLFLAPPEGKGAAMRGTRTTPPIDREVPARVETATFAVG